MLSVITSELFKILGTEEGNPLQACALGPVGVLPKETEIFNTRLIDFPVIAPHNVDAARSCLLTRPACLSLQCVETIAGSRILMNTSRVI